jgi:penicillin-insensitive murein DD-endopeptidase
MQMISTTVLLTLVIAVTSAAAEPNAWSKIATPTNDRAVSIGGYTNGCFSGGKALPAEGRGYQVVRLSRKRYYGHPELIRFIQDLGNKVADEQLGLMLVADMGQPRGGPMPGGHVSHQNGLDADIWLPLNYQRSKGNRDGLKSIAYADREK